MISTLFSSLLLLSCLAGWTNQNIPDPGAFNQESREKTSGQVGQHQEDEETLTPLTESERLLDPRSIVSGQPDFVADLSFFVSHTVSGFGGAEHIVRKGNRYRDESQFWTFVGEIDRSTSRLYPKTKVYDDMQPLRVQTSDHSMLALKTLALDLDFTFVALGKVQIDGHECIKIEAIRKGESMRMYLYAARDLSNLVIVIRTINPPSSMIQRLSNISLDVPNSLVEIPAEYKPIEHDRWTKVESAKVTYNGKPSQDFGVFRAPGGELFIWVNDAYYPWHYLVRQQKGNRRTGLSRLAYQSRRRIHLADERD
jgi:hypothetical protein